MRDAQRTLKFTVEAWAAATWWAIAETWALLRARVVDSPHQLSR